MDDKQVTDGQQDNHDGRDPRDSDHSFSCKKELFYLVDLTSVILLITSNQEIPHFNAS